MTDVSCESGLRVECIVREVNVAPLHATVLQQWLVGMVPVARSTYVPPPAWPPDGIRRPSCRGTSAIHCCSYAYRGRGHLGRGLNLGNGLLNRLRLVRSSGELHGSGLEDASRRCAIALSARSAHLRPSARALRCCM